MYKYRKEKIDDYAYGPLLRLPKEIYGLYGPGNEFSDLIMFFLRMWRPILCADFDTIVCDK